MFYTFLYFYQVYITIGQIPLHNNTQVMLSYITVFIADKSIKDLQTTYPVI